MRDLERTRDTATAPFECSQMRDIATLKEYLALVGFGDPGEDIKHRRFAGAVWTNHAKGFSFVEMHAQIIVSQQRAEAFGDTAEFKNRAHSRLGRAARQPPSAQPEAGAASHLSSAKQS
jgi:hypothetical protein